MEWIHYDPYEMYGELVECEEFHLYEVDTTLKSEEVTCPKCLAVLWVLGNGGDIAKRYEDDSKEYGKYIPYGRSVSGPDNWSYTQPYEFLSRIENKDLYWQFMQECVATKSFFTNWSR